MRSKGHFLHSHMTDTFALCVPGGSVTLDLNAGEARLLILPAH